MEDLEGEIDDREGEKGGRGSDVCRCMTGAFPLAISAPVGASDDGLTGGAGACRLILPSPTMKGESAW